MPTKKDTLKVVKSFIDSKVGPMTSPPSKAAKDRAKDIAKPVESKDKVVKRLLES